MTEEIGGSDRSSLAPADVAGRLLLVPGRLERLGASAMSGRLKLNGVEAGARKDWPAWWVC